MSLDDKLQTLNQIAHVIATLNNASVNVIALSNAANVLAVDIFNLINKDSTAAAISGTVAGVEGSAEGDKQTVNTKKEAAPKATPKKVTAAAIIDDTPEVKPEQPKIEEPKIEEPKIEEPKIEEPKIEEPEISLVDDDEASLIDDEPEVIDYVELRTECRALINSAVDRVGKPAVVAILDYIHAKSLKDVKDTLLPWLRTKLTEAK